MSNSALGDNPRPSAQTSRDTRVATTSKEKPPANADSPRLSAFVAACFFLSGAAGLVYQVIWVRLIEKVIGSAPFAVAAVLSVFMAGLALGSWRAGRVIDRQPGRAALLALYGKLELGIGVLALAVPVAMAIARPVYRAFYDPLLEHFWCHQAAALAGCALVLIPPAALMGATLPVLCRFYVRRLDHLGRRTGWLYGLNTAGAALGVALCGLVLIPHLGVWPTLGLFAALNFLIGGACLGVARRLAAEPAPPKARSQRKAPPSPAPPEPGPTDGMHRQMRWGLAIFAVSGFCAMAYEVLWTRLLGLIAGPTTYSFTLVVTTFIIGLALGSLLLRRAADHSTAVFTLLTGSQLAAAAAALLVSQTLGNSQLFFAKLIYIHQDRFSHLMLTQSLVIFAVLVTPTVLLGATFPLVNRLVIRSMAAMGRTLGTAYAVNTLGAIAGSFAAGFLLIPWLGMADGLRLVSLAQFGLSGLALLHGGRFGRFAAAKRLVAASLLLAAGLLLLPYPSWRTDLLSRGWYRDFGAFAHVLEQNGWIEALRHGADRIAVQRGGLEVVFQAEGMAGFTTVEKEITSLGIAEYALFNSGKADASSHGDRSTQALSAHIPLLFHPGARDVMVLGLASGMTPGEVLLYPIRKLDVVEINAQVAAACRRFFSPWNNNCLEDPRTRLIVQDGRNHLALTRAAYDVIISEPSNPWMAGLANLYSLEFFRLVRERLNPGGLFAQWIQSYEMDWDTFALLGRTFSAVFPEGALVKIGPVDYLLLGFRDGGGFDWQAARDRQVYAQRSRNVVFPSTDFLVHLVLTEDLGQLFGTGPLHTDDRPLLEFAAPRTLYSGTLDIDQAAADRRRFTTATRSLREARSGPETLLDLVAFSASANVPMFNVLPLAALDSNQKARYRAIVTDYCQRVLVPAYGLFEDPALKTLCAGIQAEAIARHIQTGKPRAMDHYNLGVALTAAGRSAEAGGHLQAALDLEPDHASARMALGLLLASGGNLDEAARHLARAAELAPRNPEAFKFLGMVEQRRGASGPAVTALSTALDLSPEDPEIQGELGIALLQQGRRREAHAQLTKALQQWPRDDESRSYLELARRQAADPGKETSP